MKKFLAVLLTAGMVMSLAACGGSGETAETEAAGSSSEEAAAEETEAGTPAHDGSKIFYTVESAPYGSIDVHKEYYSWHTQFYGISETLFRITDDMNIEPWLAESYETNENVTTITLKDGVCFSNGEPLTADMVKRNLERVAEVNTRFMYIADWTIEAPDDKTVVITTPDVYPTLLNDLSTAELGMMDLDNTTDFDNAPICTGPFVVDEFVPEGDISVKYNENYWGGDVQLDGAVFYNMSDEESKLLAMQNGEINGYVDISPSSREVYEMDPDMYTVTTVPTERRAYALINSAKVSDNIRQALCIGIDKETLATYMNGIIAAADGIFTSGTYYGGVQAPTYDPEKAKELIEADGYTMNDSTGIYEKDGTPLSLTISTYAKRSLDTIAILMQEQYKAIGIDIQIKLEDNPDGTYMTSKDFDIGMYASITDKAGEPFTFLNQITTGSWLDVCGFGNSETDELIDKLRYATDEAEKTEIADEIMTKVYDSYDYLMLGQYNKSTVIQAGASGLGENSPLQFYGVDASTNM